MGQGNYTTGEDGRILRTDGPLQGKHPDHDVPPMGSIRDCQPFERQRQQRPDYGSTGLGRTMQATEQKNGEPNAAKSSGERVSGTLLRPCTSCAHFVPQTHHCTVGALINPVTAERFGGRPSEPRHWQPASELRSKDPPLSSCGVFGHQWEAIF